MNTRYDHTQENKKHSGTNEIEQKQSTIEPQFQFADNRTETVAQLKLLEIANKSKAVKQLKVMQSLADSSQGNSLVTQLKSISSNKTIQMFPGEGLLRRMKAKFSKKKQDGMDSLEGAYHGGGMQSRYERLDAPTEQDHYDDLLDNESEGRERLEKHPIAERVRKYGMQPVTYAAKKGGEALGTMAAGPVGGLAGGEIVGKGLEKLDEAAKNKLNEGGNAYKVLRDRDEDEF